jgi:hypothetical protein
MTPHKPSIVAPLVTIILIGSIILICLGLAMNEAEHPDVCKHEETVTQILELRYRDAVVLLSDGSKRNVNQATMKPGDKFCTYWSKE